MNEIINAKDEFEFRKRSQKEAVGFLLVKVPNSRDDDRILYSLSKRILGLVVQPDSITRARRSITSPTDDSRVQFVCGFCFKIFKNQPRADFHSSQTSHKTISGILLRSSDTKLEIRNLEQELNYEYYAEEKTLR
jgi:hypothetical protein